MIARAIWVKASSTLMFALALVSMNATSCSAASYRTHPEEKTRGEHHAFAVSHRAYGAVRMAHAPTKTKRRDPETYMRGHTRTHAHTHTHTHTHSLARATQQCNYMRFGRSTFCPCSVEMTRLSSMSHLLPKIIFSTCEAEGKSSTHQPTNPRRCIRANPPNVHTFEAGCLTAHCMKCTNKQVRQAELCSAKVQLA